MVGSEGRELATGHGNQRSEVPPENLREHSEPRSAQRFERRGQAMTAEWSGRIYLDGSWVEGSGGTAPVVEPATHSVTVPLGFRRATPPNRVNQMFWSGPTVIP